MMNEHYAFLCKVSVSKMQNRKRGILKLGIIFWNTK